MEVNIQKDEIKNLLKNSKQLKLIFLDEKLSNIFQKTIKYEIINFDYEKCFITILGETYKYLSFFIHL